jgi:NAD(P)-dependent dehydrogenase (short-subunit alcohol dehydrogenase family)
MDVRTRPAETLPDRPLSGRVAVVTGAAKGLGAAITDVLARDGAHVVFAGRDVEALRSHAEHIDQRYPYRESLTVRCDASDEAQVSELAEAAVARFEGIDILVNAHGIIGPIETPAQEVTPDRFREVLEVNVVGVFLTCRACIPHLIRRGGGRIVNIAGTSGLRGYRNRVAYSSSKWAVRGLTRTLALELGPHGITVNTVCPNVTHGQRMETIVREKARKTDRTPEEVYRDYTDQTALGRFVEDTDVAAAVAYLVSDGARNVTGHDIVVDAGWDV